MKPDKTRTFIELVPLASSMADEGFGSGYYPMLYFVCAALVSDCRRIGNLAAREYITHTQRKSSIYRQGEFERLRSRQQPTDAYSIVFGC